MLSRIVLLLSAIGCALAVSAQQPVSMDAIPPASPLQATVNDSFGEGFALDAKFPSLTADLDGDGAEDLVVVTFAKNPMANSNEKNFRVADPYDAYFGFGDPRVTTKFSNFGDGTSHCVLIIHDWHNPAPKAKFVIVNLPFEKLSITRVAYKKKTLTVLAATELGGLSANVFWDGKKYKWEPTEFSVDEDQLKLK